MRNLTVCLMLAMATAAAAAKAQPAAPVSGLPAAEIDAVDKACDASIRGFSIDKPLDHLLATHGVYVEGYGAVFITDVNLVALPPLFGFGKINNVDLARIHESKVKRLPEVRKLMGQIVLAASGTLAHLSPDESILLHFNFYSMATEDHTGLPKSISVQGRKRDLLDAVARKAPDDFVSSILKVRVE